MPRAISLAALAAIALVMGLLLPASPLSGTAASAATTETTLTATAATWTTSRKPTTPHGNLPYLSATSSQDRTYVKFDGSALRGKKILSAKLVLQVAASSATKPGVVVHPASASWTERSLTHRNRPKDSKVRLNSVAPQARSHKTVTVPLRNLSMLSSKGAFALRVQYSQRSVPTTYVATGPRAPRLIVTVQSPVSSSKTTTPAPSATSDPTTTTATTAPTTTAPTTTAPTTTAPTTTAPTTTAAAPTTTTATPVAASDKKVFAHYFPPYPLSFDNKPADSDYYTRNYLTVGGEGGIHAEYGGLLRDRPIAVGQSSSATWKVDNLRTEIRQAKAGGIDGFVVDIMNIEGLNWETTKNLFIAAEKEGFKVVPMIDGTARISRLTPAQVASAIAPLYRSPAAFKSGADYLLSSFKAEGPGAAWFKQVIDLLEKKHGVPISFQAVFLSASSTNMAAFAPISDSFGNWGARSPQAINSLPAYDAQAEKYGKDWMEPVAPQDMRPRSGVYAEAGNTEALRAGWAKAIRDDAEYVQMVTWNDYSESSQFAPSASHGTAFLEISRYYSDWFRTGTAPRITADKLFVTHREHFANAVPAVKHDPITPTLSGSPGTPRDTVEALVFLTAPATVEITVGGVKSTFSARAGVSAFTAPLRLGAVQAKIIRNGTAVKTAASPYKVVATPEVQDLQYYAVTGK